MDELVVALSCESGISRSEVSRICQGLDTQAQAFLNRPLELSRTRTSTAMRRTCTEGTPGPQAGDLQGLARGPTNKVIAGGAEDCSGNGSRPRLSLAPEARGEEPHPSRRESHGPGPENSRRQHPRHGALPLPAAGDPQHPHFSESLSDVMVPGRLRPG